jgi:hypothetical protein
VPKDWYRSDIKFSEVNRTKLCRLQQEIYQKTGKKVTMTSLVNKLVEVYFERVENYPFTFGEQSSR